MKEHPLLNSMREAGKFQFGQPKLEPRRMINAVYGKSAVARSYVLTGPSFVVNDLSGLINGAIEKDFAAAAKSIKAAANCTLSLNVKFDNLAKLIKFCEGRLGKMQRNATKLRAKMRWNKKRRKK